MDARRPRFTAALEYAYSGAAAGTGRRIGSMLWSDPPDDPSEELRKAEAMLRRAGIVLAVASVLLLLLLGWSG
ncbi:hypothetical protein C3486_36025 [Streptomyces sp. Ru73]|nr:hypothetical protein C3486_36025 [Streptomyces sp. Ru73]